MAQKDGYWVVRTYKAGLLGEKTKFWVPGKRPDKKLSRRQRNAIKKQSQNEYSAVKRFARDMHHNYAGEDSFLTLDYSKAGYARLEKWAKDKGVDLASLTEEEHREVIWATAEHELGLCLRRAQHKAKKAGVEIKAMMTTSDQKYDHKLQQYMQVRIHHHMIINRDAVPFFQEAWEKLGNYKDKYLSTYGEDWTELADYIVSQVRRIPEAKKYRSTRNVIHPEPKDRIVNSEAELQVPRGGKLLFRREFTKSGQPQYIRYLLPKVYENRKLPNDCEKISRKEPL